MEIPFSCNICYCKCPSKDDMKTHMDTHKEKPFSCSKCDYKCPSSADMKRHIDTHKEKPFSCSECDYKSPSNADMKRHMDTHKEKNRYLCDVDKCNYTCEETDSLELHKITHKQKWSDIARSPPRYNKYLQKPDIPIKRNNPIRQNQEPAREYSRNDSQRNPKGLITGSNRKSPLSVTPRAHWAYVFATGYSTRTQEKDVQREVAAGIERRLGKRYAVYVTKEQSRYDTYSSFRISIHIANSEILMESSLWPENVRVKWYKHNRDRNITDQ